MLATPPQSGRDAGSAEVDLMHMKVAKLKEELEARNEAKSGNKAWARLRRRLHAAIVRDYLQRVVVRRWMMCRL